MLTLECLLEKGKRERQRSGVRPVGLPKQRGVSWHWPRTSWRVPRRVLLRAVLPFATVIAAEPVRPFVRALLSRERWP